MTPEQQKAIALAKARQRQAGEQQYPSAVPVPSPSAGLGGLYFKQESIPEEPQPGLLDINRQIVSRETGREYLPMAGAMLGAAVGGPGALLPALGATIGGGAGEAGRQTLEGQKVDLYDVSKEGAKLGAGTLAGGLTFKAIGKVADKIFNPQPLSQAAERAAKFAQKKGLPFPLETGGGGAARNVAALSTLPARFVTQKNAAKVTQFINRMALEEVPKLAPQAKPISQVVQKGREFFRNIYYPAKEAGQEGFDKFVSSVGPTTLVGTRNFTNTIDDAIKELADRGFISTTAKGTMKSTDKLGKYILNLRNSPPEKTLEAVEVIRKEVSKLGRDSKVQPIANMLKESILKDYDEVGAKLGVSARELAQDAIQKSAIFFKLKKEFPELEFFTKDFTDEKWLGLLFQGRNAKALSEIRKQSPELYKELSDTWLANTIQSNTRSTDGVIGKVLDGPALRKWFESNRKELNKILGREKTQVLDNFSRYASFTTKAVQKSDKDYISGFEAISRGAGELGAIAYQPYIMIPGEVTAYMLAKGLSNPSSKLFKLFTRGPSITFKQLSRGGLTLGGQLAVKPLEGKPATFEDQTLTIPENDINAR